jgi:hypothetical protein
VTVVEIVLLLPASLLLVPLLLAGASAPRSRSLETWYRATCRSPRGS